MSLTITPICAAALTAVFAVVSVRMIAFRRADRAAFGDGWDADLQRRVRAQGSSAEYAPLGIVLLLMGQLQRGQVLLLHGLGLALLAGRLCHGYGISLRPRSIALRTTGVGLTLAAPAGLAATSFTLIGR
jgi:uncharacterized protein